MRSDAAHLAEIADIEDIASNMPTKVPWSTVSDAVGDLQKVAFGIGLGDTCVLRPSFAGLRIQPNRFQGVASAVSAGYAFWAALHGLGGDIHDGTEFAVATTHGDAFLALHGISPWIGPRLGTQASALWLLGSWWWKRDEGGRDRPQAGGEYESGNSLIGRTREIVSADDGSACGATGCSVDGFI